MDSLGLSIRGCEKLRFAPEADQILHLSDKFSQAVMTSRAAVEIVRDWVLQSTAIPQLG